MTLPVGASGKLAYAAGATTFAFVSDGSTNGIYKLEASAPGFLWSSRSASCCRPMR
jgi:hypothetical protein